MERRPAISIVVPCYNAVDTISDTLKSIQKQTCHTWEAICIDDESPDRTPEILRAFAESDPRIRWAPVPHGGLGAARNHGVRLARAERIFFLDNDDTLRPDALELLLGTSKRFDDRLIVAAGYELLDHRCHGLSLFHIPTVSDFSVDTLLRGCRFSPMTLVPAAILGPRPFAEDKRVHGCEDWDLWLRLAHADAACVTIPRVLFGYRLRAKSLGHDADRTYATGRRVLERWLPYAREPDAVRDAMHRWACSCGAMALASGSSQAIRRYFEDLPPLEPTNGFPLAVAGGLHWAFLFVHGATGKTWRERASDWWPSIEAWLEHGPVAAHADPILECLRRVAGNPQERLAAVQQFIYGRLDARRIIMYGLGTNGVILLEQLRADADLPTVEWCLADDQADDLTFSVLDLPRVDPRQWKTWPDDTLVLVTPNRFMDIQATLTRAGGREGMDYLIVPACTQSRLVSSRSSRKKPVGVPCLAQV